MLCPANVRKPDKIKIEGFEGDSLVGKLNDLAQIMTFMKDHHGNVFEKIHSEGTEAKLTESVESYLKTLTDGEIESVNDLKKISRERQIAIERELDLAIDKVASYDGLDLTKQIQDTESEHTSNLYHLMRAFKRKDNKMYKFFNAVLPKTLKGFFHYNIQRQFEQIPPMKEAYADYLTHKDYSEGRAATLDNQLRKLAKVAYKAAKIKVSFAEFNSMVRKVDVESGKIDPDVMMRIKDVLNAENNNDASVQNVVSNLLRYRRSFNKINYGYETWDEVKQHVDNYRKQNPEASKELTDNQIALKLAPENSILAFYRNSINSFKRLRKGAENSDPVFGQELDTFERIIDNFSPAKDYLPTKKMDDDSISIMAESLQDKGLPGAPSFLKHKRSNVDDGDVLDIARHNIGYFNYVARQMSLAALVNKAKATTDMMESSTLWMKGSKGKTVSGAYVAMKDWIYGMERVLKNDFRKAESSIEKTLRNTVNTVNLIPALMMASPSTGVSNLAGGFLQLSSKMGLKGAMDYFKNNKRYRNEDSELYGVADKFAQQYITGLGKPQEFQVFKDDNEPSSTYGLPKKITLENASKMGRDAANKIADFSTRTGLLRILSLQSTEGMLRAPVAGKLYETMRDKIALSPQRYKNSDGSYNKKALQNLARESSTNALYEMNRALGNFDQTNKPIWTWALDKGLIGGDDTNAAQRMAMQMLGAGAKLWYMFRMVTETNFGLFTDSLVKMSKYSQKRSSIKSLSRNHVSGAGFGLFIPAAIAIANFAFDKDEDSLQTGLLKSTDMLDGVSGAAKLLYGMAPLVSDMKIPEAEFADVWRDNMRWATGVLGGYSVMDIADGIATEGGKALASKDFKQNVLRFAFQHTLPYNLYRMGTFGVETVKKLGYKVDEDIDTVGMTRKEAEQALFYGARSNAAKASRELRESLGDLSKIDYLSFIEKFGEAFFYRADTEMGKHGLAMYKADKAESVINGLFRLNIYNHPNLYHLTPMAKYEKQQAATAFSEIYRNYDDELTVDSMGNLLRQITKYGRIY
jgi:hypothetical protein